MALRFDWSDLWDYYHSIESRELKLHLEAEVISDGWLYKQSAKEQKKILSGAPEDFVARIIKFIKPEVAIDLGYNPYR